MQKELKENHGVSCIWDPPTLARSAAARRHSCEPEREKNVGFALRYSTKLIEMSPRQSNKNNIFTGCIDLLFMFICSSVESEYCINGHFRTPDRLRRAPCVWKVLTGKEPTPPEELLNFSIFNLAKNAHRFGRNLTFGVLQNDGVTKSIQLNFVKSLKSWTPQMDETNFIDPAVSRCW